MTPSAAEQRLQQILATFPWRRRKPRTSRPGRPAAGVRLSSGEQMWADPEDLVAHADPAPALAYVATHDGAASHVTVRALVERSAPLLGLELRGTPTQRTQLGVAVLERLLRQVDLDPDAEVGGQPLREWLVATWAVAAGLPRGPEA
jgi:hypothetical protein